nr:unnamed protein product [Spirometra erinaceieuropaei]
MSAMPRPHRPCRTTLGATQQQPADLNRHKHRHPCRQPCHNPTAPSTTTNPTSGDHISDAPPSTITGTILSAANPASIKMAVGVMGEEEEKKKKEEEEEEEE